MVAHQSVGESFKDCAIVFLFDRIPRQLPGIQTTGAGFLIENGAVEIFFGGKVPEDHCFRDAGRFGNFFGGSAAKAAVRKQPHRHP